MLIHTLELLNNSGTVIQSLLIVAKFDTIAVLSNISNSCDTTSHINNSGTVIQSLSFVAKTNTIAILHNKDT